MPAVRRGRLELAGRLPYFYGGVVLAFSLVGMFSSGPGQACILSVFIEPIGRETGRTGTVISGALLVSPPPGQQVSRQ